MIYYVNHTNPVVDDIYEYITNLKFVFIDTETTGLDSNRDEIILLQIGDNTNQLIFDMRTAKEQGIEFLRSLKDKLFVAHNAKFDCKMLLSIGIEHKNWFCTMVAGQVIYNGLPLKFSLQDMLKRHLDIEMSKEQRKTFIGKSKDSEITQAEITYAAKDIQDLELLFNRLFDIIYKVDVQYLLSPLDYNLEGKMIFILAKLEHKGVLLDVDKWRNNTDKFKERLFEIENNLLRTEIRKLKQSFPRLKQKGIYNLNSTDDLYLIFKLTGELPNFPEREDLAEYIEKQRVNAKIKQIKHSQVIKKGIVLGTTGSLFDIEDSETVQIEEKERYSFGVGQLKEYIETKEDSFSPLEELITLILEQREMKKLTSTYGDSYLEHIHPNTNRIHTDYSQTFTKTGRLSSSKPNLQNLPRNNDIRNCFIAEEGYSLLTIDYGGQELKILASQSKDEILLKAANEGLDLHTHLGTKSYRIITENPEYEINKSERTKHKPVLFGWIYGSGPYRIHKVLEVPINIAKKVKLELEKTLFKAAKYLNRIRDNAVKTKVVYDNCKANRRRYFKDIEEHSLRKQAGNFTIQATGSSMIKEAMVETEYRIIQPLLAQYPKTGAIMQIHDEVVYQLPTVLAESIGIEINKLWIEVGNSYLDGVTIEADYTILQHWNK